MNVPTRSAAGLLGPCFKTGRCCLARLRQADSKSPSDSVSVTQHSFLLNDFKSFNSLSKVLFTFPSRYLCAIGFGTCLALGGVYLPLWTAIPNCPTLGKVSRFLGQPDGLITLHDSFVPEDFGRPSRSFPSLTYNSEDFQVGFGRFTRRYCGHPR